MLLIMCSYTFDVQPFLLCMGSFSSAHKKSKVNSAIWLFKRTGAGTCSRAGVSPSFICRTTDGQ